MPTITERWMSHQRLHHRTYATVHAYGLVVAMIILFFHAGGIIHHLREDSRLGEVRPAQG